MPDAPPQPDDMPVLVWTNTGTPGEARAIAARCVGSGLAAAVNIDAVRSHYRWEGAVHEADEHRLCIKTVAGAVEDIRRVIAELHGYAEPALLVTPVTGGSASYLDWLRAHSGRREPG